MNLRALAIAGLLVTVGGCCSKPKGSSGSPPPPTTPSATAAPKRQILMRAGSDDPPAHWSSRATSKSAAPSFARADGYAPQLPAQVKEELFEAAKSKKPRSPRDAGGPDPCLVVCYVHSLVSADTGFFKGLFNSAASELDVHVTVEKGMELVARGPEDRNWQYVSVPLVDCSARSPWSFRLRDRDGGSSYDELGKFALRPEFPATKKDRKASFVCRSVDQEDVEAALRDAFAESDKELEEIVENLAIDPKDPTLGVKPVLTRMQSAVNRLAGWVGWADPRVIRRRDWGLRILSTLQSDRREFVISNESSAGRSAGFKYSRGEYDVEVESLACDAATIKPYEVPVAERRGEPPLRCVLRLRTKNVGEDTLSSSLGDLLGWQINVARTDGETSPVRFLALEGPGVTTTPHGVRILEPGATCTVVLGLSELAFSAEGARPALIFMAPFMSDGPVFLALPRATGAGPAGSASAAPSR